VTIIAIEDPDDPRMAPYREIRERDMVGRQGLFVAEGEVVLRTLLGPTSRFAPVSILVAAKRMAKLLPLLELAGQTPVFAAGQEVMDRIAGFPIHRGILAIGAIGEPSPVQTILGRAGQPAMLVVAFGIANHDNIGGIFRNAAAFGASGVLLDADCCDPLYRKAIRVSAGAVLTQPFARFGRDEDPLELLAQAGFDAIALSPRGVRELREIQAPPRVALLLGGEGPGLPPEILSRASSVRIAMAPHVDSLNVAVTSGIVLHHLATVRR
jgi:tRNA G18 (ribose-2'-O)-methylase SpoU